GARVSCPAGTWAGSVPSALHFELVSHTAFSERCKISIRTPGTVTKRRPRSLRRSGANLRIVSVKPRRGISRRRAAPETCAPPPAPPQLPGKCCPGASVWVRTGVKAALRLGEGSYYTEWILAIGGKHHRSSKKIVRAQDAVRPRILTKRIMVGKHNVALGAEEQ